MKHLFFSLFFILFPTLIFCQQGSADKSVNIQISKEDSIAWSSVKKLKLTQSAKEKTVLPVRVNNSNLPIFSPLRVQKTWDCGQYSGVRNAYSYELNRLLNRNPTDLNLFSTLFNMVSTVHGSAQHTLKTWETMKSIGCLTEADFPEEIGLYHIQQYSGSSSAGYNCDSKYLSGYNWYYKAMQNKVDEYFSIPLNSEEGILTMKHWLHNHLAGELVGGIGIIYLGIPYPTTTTIPTGYDAGKIIIPEFTTHVNHSMNIVGYDDRIEWDFNQDGQITNNIDITGDGIVDVRDWEKGAVIIANSYGSDWGNQGFVYVMYRTLAMQSPQFGIWNSSMYVVKPKLPNLPKTTLRFSIAHRNKSAIKAFAGISTNVNSTSPEFSVEIPFLNFINTNSSISADTLGIGIPVEFGFDVTPLLTHIQPGQKARFFFQILEVDPQNSFDGYIQNFSVIDYTHGSKEVFSNSNSVNIVNNGLTSLFVDVAPDFSKPQLTSNKLPNAVVANPYQTELTAQKGTPPYRYHQTDGYTTNETPFLHPNYQGLIQLTLPTVQTDYISLSPEFPICIYDSIHQGRLYVNPNGFIHFREHEYLWPFLSDDYTQLKAHTAIAPLMTKLVYDKPAFGIWQKSTPDSLFIRWIGRFATDVNSYLDFSVSISKVGDVRFYYDSIHYSSFDPWMRGISKGNGVEMTKIGSDFFVNSHTSFSSKLFSIDTSITITSEGVLSTNPAVAFSNKKVNVSILDNNDIETHDFTYLSTGTPPELIVSSTLLNTNNQDWYSPLDTVKVTIGIVNISNTAKYNIPIQLCSTSLDIDLLKSTYTIPEIQGSSIITLNCAFVFKPNASLKAERFENLIIRNSRSGEQLAVIKANITPSIPLEIGTPVLSSPNGDAFISNATHLLIFPVFNRNRNAITNLSASLKCLSNVVSVVDTVDLMDSISGYSTGYIQFRVRTDDLSAPNLIIPFSGELTDSRGMMVPFLKTYQLNSNLIETYEDTNQLYIFPSAFSDTIPYIVANRGFNSSRSMLYRRSATSTNLKKFRSFSFQTNTNSLIEFDYLCYAKLALSNKRLIYLIDGVQYNLDTTSEWKHISHSIPDGSHSFALWFNLMLFSDSIYIDNLSIPLSYTPEISYSVYPNEIKLKCRPDTLLNFNIELNSTGKPFDDIYYDIVPPENKTCNWLNRQGATTLTANQSTMLPFNVSTVGLPSGEYTSYVRFKDEFLFSPVKIILSVIDNYQTPSAGTVSVYPNPAIDKISFDFISSDAKTASLELIDILGRPAFYYEQSIDFGSELKTLTFDVSAISMGNSTKGLYLYNLKVGDVLYRGKITIIQ
jgi:hypothetical protein